ncbi:hypothetical protein BCR33DRAFT_783052 [Rhizoclosmatium globosum]|uniref:Uncharacterized protein n=1 Tax=Rhizoclosmatium globosum TaxID=329046 RepID=A0A1Y2CLS0_9FUNG|nr:hypothetical protein BCR33DRAFT_783052 [Rhizoclosmatium globosum]|eukprot:ORY47295.1 hypothetical protein BCR33DRAFT_783052 [Rhizoclosmatium globosum]
MNSSRSSQRLAGISKMTPSLATQILSASFVASTLSAKSLYTPSSFTSIPSVDGLEGDFGSKMGASSTTSKPASLKACIESTLAKISNIGSSSITNEELLRSLFYANLIEDS